MTSMNDESLLRQLKSNENASFQILYKYYFPVVASYIQKNSGSLQDAEDVFQETSIILLYKIRQSDFILTASLKTYLFSIAKNSWLKKLRDAKMIVHEELDLYENASSSLEEEAIQEPREKKLHVWIDRITKNCQKIIKALYFHQEPIDALMEKMGWKNRHTADNQKYKCLEQIRKETLRK